MVEPKAGQKYVFSILTSLCYLQPLCGGSETCQYNGGTIGGYSLLQNTRCDLYHIHISFKTIPHMTNSYGRRGGWGEKGQCYELLFSLICLLSPRLIFLFRPMAGSSAAFIAKELQGSNLAFSEPLGALGGVINSSFIRAETRKMRQNTQMPSTTRWLMHQMQLQFSMSFRLHSCTCSWEQPTHPLICWSRSTVLIKWRRGWR